MYTSSISGHYLEPHIYVGVPYINNFYNLTLNVYLQWGYSLANIPEGREKNYFSSSTHVLLASERELLEISE